MNAGLYALQLCCFHNHLVFISRLLILGLQSAAYLVHRFTMSQSSSPDRKRRKLERDSLKEMEATRLYEYGKIEGDNGIRLIALLPGSFYSKVRCEFIISDLEHPPDYEALSYTWVDSDGDRSRDGTVFCEPGGQRILVTRNCEDALKHLRLRHEPRFLWVDAISINQADIPERNRQVSMMPRIYHTASRVIVYLGGATTETNEFLDFLKNGPLNIERAFERFIPIAKSILSRRWFKRLWILQEVALARAANIMCGDKIISWQKLAEYYEEVFSKTDHIHRFPHLKIVFEYGLQGIKPMKILPELFTCSYLHSSSDPRDRVFALLGIVGNERPISMVTEYGASNGKVFKELAIHFITQFNLLFTDRQLTQTSEGWSSWVFDWSQPRKHPNFPLRIGTEVSIDDLGGGLGFLKISGRQVLHGTVCRGYVPQDPRKVGWGEVMVDRGLTFASELTESEPPPFDNLKDADLRQTLQDGMRENLPKDIQEAFLQGVIAVEVSPGCCVLLSQMGDHYSLFGGVADFHRCVEAYQPQGSTKLHTEFGQCTPACSRPHLTLGEKETFIIL